MFLAVKFVWALFTLASHVDYHHDFLTNHATQSYGRIPFPHMNETLFNFVWIGHWIMIGMGV
jgi:hypothetical protein